MNNFNPLGLSRDKWGMNSSSAINYNKQANLNNMNSGSSQNQRIAYPVKSPRLPTSLLQDDHVKKLAEIQIQMLNKPHSPNISNMHNQPPMKSNFSGMRQMAFNAPSQNSLALLQNRYNFTQPVGSASTSSIGIGPRQTGINPSIPYKPMIDRQQLFDRKIPSTAKSGVIDGKYNPFAEDNVEDNMDISDDEGNRSQADEGKRINLNARNIEIKSGASFYQGLILFIPPFEKVLGNSLNNSPAMKMLYASFEFSFKTAIRIENKPTTTPNVSEATVLFQGNIIATGRGVSPHIEASIRALELLSETCYTIQAKPEYFAKCKLLNGLDMKTLNLKKWEYLSQKHPKIEEVTQDSHIQKTLAVFLFSHTSTGIYEDIVFCNLSRQDVNNIKKVVDFFKLTMLPCSMQTNLSLKQTPCIVSIHKYASAKKLLDILMDSGGENEHFKVYAPDTFRQFYMLHPIIRGKFHPDKENVTTLNDQGMQATILKPYENIICEMFEKNQLLREKVNNEINTVNRKPGDDFMMENFQIDMGSSKKVEPVERMQLLLKYMEQLQEYGSRVLNSGKPEMIKIYHNAIDNVRKDLDACRQDIEKQQKAMSLDVIKKSPGTFYSEIKRSSPSRRKSPSRKRSRSPAKKSSDRNKRRSISPHRKHDRRSPRRTDRARRSTSPRRKPRTPSPPRRSRVPSQAAQARDPIRRAPSPRRVSPTVRRPRPSQNDEILVSIFRDKFKRYTDSLRKFRIEIEDTPIERRGALRDRLEKYKESYNKFFNEALMNRSQLGGYREQLEVLRDELVEQKELIQGKPGPNDLPRSVTPPFWMNVRSFEASDTAPVTYPLPGPRTMYGAQMQKPPPPPGTGYW